MMRTRNALDALVAGLSGRQVTTADWEAVITLANRTLLTPTLFSCLQRTGQVDRLPEDVGEYLQFIHDCNQRRNRCLYRQLDEAVAALNGLGIVPVLLKGAVALFLSSADNPPSRIISDLDVAVEPAEEDAARTCLVGLGYAHVPGVRGLARTRDVGILEIRPSRGDGCERPRLVQRSRLSVKIPAAPSRALHWITHDLLKEGDYWRGRTDLRHLHDLAKLAEKDGLDWTALRMSLPDQSARNALDTQLLALHHFFGASVPMHDIQRPLVRFQHWRRLFTMYHPVIGSPLRLAGNVAWGIRRLLHSRDLARRGAVDFARRVSRTMLAGNLRSKL